MNDVSALRYAIIKLKKGKSIRYYDNQLHLFRRLKKCSIRLTKCEGAIDFIRLCQNFDVILPFAKVDATRSNKWKKSASNFEKEIVEEELKGKLSQLKQLKEDFTTNLRCLHETCSVFNCVVIIKILRSLQRTQFQELIKCHTKKLSRLISHVISKDIDIDAHINNISSCHLSFFGELILCRGLKFSLPQHCSSKDIQVSFEKAFWRLDPPIKDPKKKELASTTLCSIALNYTSQERPYSP